MVRGAGCTPNVALYSKPTSVSRFGIVINKRVDTLSSNPYPKSRFIDIYSDIQILVRVNQGIYPVHRFWKTLTIVHWV